MDLSPSDKTKGIQDYGVIVQSILNYLQHEYILGTFANVKYTSASRPTIHFSEPYVQPTGSELEIDPTIFQELGHMYNYIMASFVTTYGQIINEQVGAEPSNMLAVPSLLDHLQEVNDAVYTEK
jgi:hypothetical protein